MNKRNVLGRGLSALIQEPVKDSHNVNEIEISRIVPNSKQPRINFNQEELEGLASSIKERGMIQPVIVTKLDEEKYELVVGERRFRAAKMLDMPTIPCIIRHYDENEKLILALIENIQRSDLNPVEEAKGYQSLMNELNLTQEDLASQLGKHRSTIANTIRLLKLPEAILEDIIAGKLSEGHARALLGLKDDSSILPIRDIIIQNNYSVRETEQLVQKYNEDPESLNKLESEQKSDQESHNIKSVSTSIPNIISKNEISDYINKLKESLKVDVKIRIKQDRGKIELNFSGKEELERLLNVLEVAGV